jgi:hypothetical protein
MRHITIFFDDVTKRQSPQSALEAAIKVGSLPLVTKLVASATPAQLSGQYGHSALSFAVLRHPVAQDASLQVLQLLLDAGALDVFGKKPARVLLNAAGWPGHSNTAPGVVRLLLVAVQRAAGGSELHRNDS